MKLEKLKSKKVLPAKNDNNNFLHLRWKDGDAEKELIVRTRSVVVFSIIAALITVTFVAIIYFFHQ
ncbi:MAG: hypothetical protein AB8F94_27100 [Saprospiraceae bacterium]